MYRHPMTEKGYEDIGKGYLTNRKMDEGKGLAGKIKNLLLYPYFPYNGCRPAG